MAFTSAFTVRGAFQTQKSQFSLSDHPLNINKWVLQKDITFAKGSNLSGGEIDLNGHKIVVKGDLKITGMKVQLNKGSLTVNNNIELTAGTLILDKKALVLKGTLIQSGGTLDLNGATLTLNGNFYQSGGAIQIGKGQLIVNGDYHLQKQRADGSYTYGSGRLSMINSEDKVVVTGDFIVDSSTRSSLSQGILEVRGNFTQKSSYRYGTTNFYSYQRHLVLLSGNKKQLVSFEDPKASLFQELKLANTSASGVVFSSAIKVTTLFNHQRLKFILSNEKKSSFNDYDSDGVKDHKDAYPLDKNRWEVSNETDTDKDGVANKLDNCPKIANKDQKDTDKDKQGDLCDTDDDNDGLSDAAEKTVGTNPLKADTDGDGVNDKQDTFPLDSKESLDFDKDGIGNNADLDDDNDGIPDAWETTYGFDPLDSTDATKDGDGDGVSNLDEFKQGTNPTVVNTLKYQEIEIKSCSPATADGVMTCSINYSNSDNNANLNGIGIRLHYNSSHLTLKRIDNVLQNKLFTYDKAPLLDNLDDDNNASTDQYLGFVWRDTSTGKWPSGALPAELIKLSFDVNKGLKIGDAITLGFSASTLEKGYRFVTKLHTLNVKSVCNLDIDNNGETKALSDGLLTLRYLFGFNGETLISNVVGKGAKRKSSVDIEAYLEKCNKRFDIDSNGETKALSDGLLILRYLFGFEGDTLINNVVSKNAERKSAVVIEGYLESIK